MHDCIFCKIVNREAKSWPIAESETAYAFLDIHPVSRYHTLVIPKTHYTNIFDIPEEDLKGVMTLLRKVCKLYEEKLGIKNIRIINNNGREAQQEVFHLHFHIIPRQLGDGLHTKWTSHPEWCGAFDDMIEKIRS
ncbi:MAG: HIT domain-containing protein [Bacteroidota bacterium]